MLTAHQVESFHRDGAIVVPGVLSADLLEAVRAETDAWIDRSRHASPDDRRFDLQASHTPEHPRVNRLNHPVALSPLYWQVATSAAVLDAVAALIGPDIRFHHSKLNMKSAQGGAAIGWHQDFAFFPHCNDDLVACGIALDNNMVENGCLTVIPGSHRGALLSHRDAEGNFVGQITEPDARSIDESQAKPVELRPGDMSIHHVKVIHGSMPNLSLHHRRLLILQFAAADAFPFEPARQDNDFGGRIVRGAPPTHARVTESGRVRLRGDVTAARSIFAVQKAMMG